MPEATGRRERKKQQTRQSISDIATALFVQRGFDAVTIAEIAAAADVAVQTVFNHFPAKEDLFFDDLGWVDGPSRTVREAAPGTPLGEVFAAGFRAQMMELAETGHVHGFVQFTKALQASATLRARRACYLEQLEERLAEAIAGGPPDLHARLVAARYSATQRVLYAELCRRLTERPGEHEKVLAEIVDLADEALTELA
ncbi:TetR family transcriptional regulator [Pseudonocardia sp. TRM90224]|uniref:TetR family transcriptional regulator n=1 Tax=Pseudonocardia sp. TRM90224 TaxID=2812678 RepID=UPI001E3E4A69|nr:TetR family transcriptional regulator [Pseudonocardia sp. TRM90224]